MKQIEAFADKLQSGIPSLKLLRGEPMSNHTSFEIGGPARAMAFPKTAFEAEALYRLACLSGIPALIIGNGTNLLVSDGGLPALIIKTGGVLSGIYRAGECEIEAESGVTLSELSEFACRQGLAGLEFANGIPGTLGGAVMMNAGAYGGEMKDVVTHTYYLGQDGENRVLTGDQHSFGYRRSFFTENTGMIMKSRLRLRPGDKEEIRREMDALMQRRKSSQPLEYPSAGSVFKRPEKHFAAALIQQAGLMGLSVGGARVSEKHAGFIINTGGATCSDVLRLIEKVREAVYENSGVTLETEVKIIGGVQDYTKDLI